MTNITVHVFDQQSSLVLSTVTIQHIARAVIKNEDRHYDEVAVHFIDNARMCELHQQYFDDPSPTDCISFPVDDEPTISYRAMGDVFVCPDTAISYSKEHKLDPYTETTLYIVHGLLHLMGYDDQTPEDQQAMRAAEARHMAYLTENDFVLMRN